MKIEQTIGLKLRLFGFLRTRIGQRFLLIFLAISLLPLVTMGWFAISESERALRRQTLAVLRSASDGAEAQLREFLHKLKEQILKTRQDETLRQALGAQLSTRPLTSTPPGPALSEMLNLQRRRFSDVQEIFVLTMDGRVAASSSPENEGQDLSSAEYFRKGKQSYFPGDVMRDPNTGRVTWVMTTPIQDVEGSRLLGVLAFRIDPETLSGLASGRRVLGEGADTQSFRIGDTGETYIVNRDHLMVTESRYLSNAVLRVRVDTEPVRAGLELGQEITADYTDYRSIKVSGASVLLRDLGWVMITEIDFSQAFIVITQMRNSVLGLTVALGLVAMFLAWDATRRIIGPIQRLSESDHALSEGNETAAIVCEEGLPRDEIGQLVHRRNERVQALATAQTQLVERTAKLRAAVTELEHVSYTIMHNMRAPLRALSGFGDIIVSTEAERLSPDGREFLGRIKTAASRMDRLICDVLSYNSTVLGNLPLGAVDVSKLMRVIVETDPKFQPNMANVHCPPDLPLVRANEAALTQCFSNLLDNSIKFARTGEFPFIQIRAEQSSGQVRIWVEDNGVGVPEIIHDRVFGIFQQGSNTGEGTGMGLAIVQKAVERMGGRVGVQSELGKGSRFWIELPAI
jgi:signal transduction histidine kinase